MAISDRVSNLVDSSVAKVARAARHALERLTPESKDESKPKRVKQSKGYRRHLREQKARQR